ncbi:LacI family DNA-binding transcriptional regulator [Asticcacaulis sp. SL142]|uniref:LacI family DNA-binding transcriptional regulator n=1 Tax=Asticcacaulis sp. SL142 TaxID=2995155 RepID=UPI00226D0D06|nr:LacI family DNA-binding transcriptional regulator [Asticcacaulis sp. SL142]WAC48297.1 LacI family DNA-binding transcriptional regulator [Asticcacaulis sp. SL142]
MTEKRTEKTGTIVALPRKTGSAPTITDVAELAGVSKKTVSRVINREALKASTRVKVEAAIEQLGFVPNVQARALAFRKNFVIVLFIHDSTSPMAMTFQRGVLSAIADSEIALAARPLDRSAPHLLSDIETFLTRQKPMGAIFLPPLSERDDIGELCQRMNIKYIRVGSAQLDMMSRSVWSNDREAVMAVVRDMVALGHRRIGFVRGPAGFRSAREREAGFRQALQNAGLPMDETLFADGEYSFESGVRAGKVLLTAPVPPTVIFASNDSMAAGVTRAAHERGLNLPGDLSIVGFDDGPVAMQLWPSLTTVHWPIAEMGALSVRKLVPEMVLKSGEMADDLPSMVESTLIRRESLSDAKT